MRLFVVVRNEDPDVRALRGRIETLIGLSVYFLVVPCCYAKGAVGLAFIIK